MGFLSVIRRWALREGMPIREIARRTGLSRNTIKKYLREGAVEPKFKVPKRPSNLDPYADRLSAWLLAQTRPLTIPPNHLDLIATTASEQKQMARIRITCQNLLCLSRQPVKPAPHVRDTCRKPDLCIRKHRDHAASPRASSRTKPASTPSLTLSLRLFSSVISI